MEFVTRPFDKRDLPAIVELSLLAWEPVFVAWQQIMGAELFAAAIYVDWRTSQQAAVEKVCLDEKLTTWVAEVTGRVVGFMALGLYESAKTGEVQMLAVHPDFQNHGIGTALNLFALQAMRAAGMTMAVVGTGGDDGHAPARRSYEKAGYTGLPLMRYYQKL